MNVANRVGWVLALAVVWMTGATPARAAFAVQDLRVTTFLTGGFNQIFGWEFTANADLTVTQLGWYDHQLDGLGGLHLVGIFDAATQQFLTSATVDALKAGGIEGPLVRSPFDLSVVGGFRYSSVPRTTLVAGRQYVIAGTSAPGDPDTTAAYFPGTGPNSLATDPNITFVRGRELRPGTLLAFPTGLSPFGGFGPSFQFEVGPAQVVPEPASLSLAGLGAICLLGYRWRRARSKASAA